MIYLYIIKLKFVIYFVLLSNILIFYFCKLYQQNLIYYLKFKCHYLAKMYKTLF